MNSDQAVLVRHEALQALLRLQRQAFARANPRCARLRVDDLGALLAAVTAHRQRLVDALGHDFGHRSAHESMLLEIAVLVDELRTLQREVPAWTKPRRARVNWQFLPSRARIVYQPLGVVGVMGAWNYQVLLTLSPLANALAAGNHVMVKPSEHAPATAQVIAELIDATFSKDHVAVVNGDASMAEAFAALPFDHLIFTGSTRVGKLVMKAAAENLTPVTLELGGKSPAIVHESFDLAVAADRIASAKWWNAGQTCVAPDYALVPRARVDAFVEAVRTVTARRLPSVAENTDYTRMINARAWQRMQDLVDEAVARGAKAHPIHPAAEHFDARHRAYPPTVIVGAPDDARVMREEIFGPVLPVVPYETLDDAIAYVNDRPRPLALYYFDHDADRVDQMLERTTSGGVTINDCVFHLPQHGLPFGGVGASGMGAYHGFDGFETFSKKKGVLLQNGVVAAALARLTKPPYGKGAERLIRFLVGRG